MNVYSKDILGIVDVQQNLSLLEELLRFHSDITAEKKLFLNIYDENGGLILSQSSPDDVVIASALSEQYHWRVDLLEPKNTKTTERMHLFGLMALCWFVITGIFNLATRFIVTGMTKPLTDLTLAVNSINISDPHKIQIPENKVYEAISLQTAFNNMLEKLIFSMEQEKNSFLLAMQAQMSPHFLYNVLSVIHAFALDSKNDKIVETCENLSFMLRYNTSYEQKFATIGEELEQTKAYLELMKARYDYMFQYTIELDSDLEQIYVPKLVIQPLCENCFMHAFTNKEPPYLVDIQVKAIEGGWHIVVKDNGVGFDEDTKRQVFEQVNKAKYEDLMNMQLGGLGLRSSVARLRIMLQKEVFCEIQSDESGGSNVRIIVKDPSC
jgi:sensor histidine kinase YesM